MSPSPCKHTNSTFPYVYSIVPRLTRLAERAPEGWDAARFADSVRAFHTAQQALISEPGTPPAEPPSIDAYLAARRELHGAGMILAVAELVQAVVPPTVPPAGAVAEALDDLRGAALDVIALATVSPISMKG